MAIRLESSWPPARTMLATSREDPLATDKLPHRPGHPGATLIHVIGCQPGGTPLDLDRTWTPLSSPRHHLPRMQRRLLPSLTPDPAGATAGRGAGLGIPTDAEARMRSGCTQSAGNRSWPTHPYRRELIMNLAGPAPRCTPKVKPESTAVPDGQTAPINVAGTKHRDGRGSQKNTPMQRRTPSHKELARTAASFRECIGAAAALRRARATRAGRLVPAAAPVLRQAG